MQEQITRLEKIGTADDDESMKKINQLVKDVNQKANIKSIETEDQSDDDMSKITEIQRLAGSLKTMVSQKKVKQISQSSEAGTEEFTLVQGGSQVTKP